MEQYTNLAASTLSSTINSSVTSLTLVSATTFPTSGTFTIIIDSELLRVTAVAGAVLTVVRGTEGTTAAAHTAGATITHVITSVVLDSIRAEMNSYGNTLPSTARAGSRHTYTDGAESLYDGTNWQHFYRGHKVVRPDFSAFGFFVNPGDVTATAQGSGFILSSLTGGNTISNATLFGKTFSGTQVTFGIEMNTDVNSTYSFMMLGDNTNKYVALVNGLGVSSTTMFCQSYTGPTGSGSNYTASSRVTRDLSFLRFRVAGGTRFFEYSNDNVNYQTLFSHADGTFVTPTRISINHTRNSNDATIPTYTKIFHYEEIP